MLVNPGVARFQNYARETVAQIQEFLRTFQPVVGLSRRPQFISLIEAMRQRVHFLRSQGKSLSHALRQRTDEALSHQSHLTLFVRRARDGVHAILLQSEAFPNRVRHLYGSTKNRKTLIVPALAGLALIILFLKMGMSDQAGNEHALKENPSSLAQVPDWTIFDEFANQPTRLATSEFVERVRTSGAALTPDPGETTGQAIRKPVPLPRPRPKRRR